MGGEPTFVSVDDYQSAEWNTAAVGPTKRQRADELIRRLRDRFAPGGLLHYGQGKWYPGEPLPRWAFALYWRRDGVPIWRDRQPDRARSGRSQSNGRGCAASRERDCRASWHRGRTMFSRPYEDPADRMVKEGRLPENIDPSDPKIDDPHERARILGAVRAAIWQAGRFRAAGAALDRASQARMAERSVAAPAAAGFFWCRAIRRSASACRCSPCPTSPPSIIRISFRPTRSAEKKPLPDPRVTHPIGAYALRTPAGAVASPPLAPGTVIMQRPAAAPSAARLPVRTALAVEVARRTLVRVHAAGRDARGLSRTSRRHRGDGGGAQPAGAYRRL